MSDETENKTEEQLQPETSTEIATQANNEIQTMWNNQGIMRQAFAAAKYLASTDLVPEMYHNKPANCLIALDVANRLGISPLMTMQNLYVVRGKPAWSGSFCAAAINGSGKFTPLEFVFVDEGGGGCFCRATRISTGAVCQSDTITMQMAQNEGWLDKSGSKWKTMPRQMMMYRAASFFARVHCPEVLLGIQTVEEVKDVAGYEDTEKPTITVTLEDTNGSND